MTFKSVTNFLGLVFKIWPLEIRVLSLVKIY